MVFSTSVRVAIITQNPNLPKWRSPRKCFPLSPDLGRPQQALSGPVPQGHTPGCLPVMQGQAPRAPRARTGRIHRLRGPAGHFGHFPLLPESPADVGEALCTHVSLSGNPLFAGRQCSVPPLCRHPAAGATQGRFRCPALGCGHSEPFRSLTQRAPPVFSVASPCSLLPQRGLPRLLPLTGAAPVTARPGGRREICALLARPGLLPRQPCRANLAFYLCASVLSLLETPRTASRLGSTHWGRKACLAAEVGVGPVCWSSVAVEMVQLEFGDGNCENCNIVLAPIGLLCTGRERS